MQKVLFSPCFIDKPQCSGRRGRWFKSSRPDLTQLIAESLLTITCQHPFREPISTDYHIYYHFFRSKTGSAA